MTSTRPFDDFEDEEGLEEYTDTSIPDTTDESSEEESEPNLKGPSVKQSNLIVDEVYLPMAKSTNEQITRDDQDSAKEDSEKKKQKKTPKKSQKPGSKSEIPKKTKKTTSKEEKAAKKELKKKLTQKKSTKNSKKINREDLRPIFDAICKIYCAAD